jgi:hypothetical protein
MQTGESTRRREGDLIDLALEGFLDVIKIRLWVVVKSFSLSFFFFTEGIFGIFGDVLERKLFVVLQHHDRELIDIAGKEEDIDIVFLILLELRQELNRLKLLPEA